MDLNKIERLAKVLKKVTSVKFEAKSNTKNNYYHVALSEYHVALSELGGLSEETAEDLAKELNAAIAPIMTRLENQMREQLALCAKIKD